MCECEDRPCCGCHLEDGSRSDNRVEMSVEAWGDLYHEDPELYDLLMETDRF